MTGHLPPELEHTRKVVMLHMNYRSRAAAHGDVPAHPTYYLKPPSTLSPPGPVRRPPGCQLLIAEGEIALVIGERTQAVPRSQAWAKVAHIAAANDFTVLDFLSADPSLTRVKGWDGFTPVGALVSARTVDPEDLEVRVTVNGQERQRDSTSTLLFPFADLVSDLSSVMTLEPGDVILTGTPAGAPPVFPGDEVTVEVGGLSTVTTTVVQSGAALSPLSPRPAVTPAVRAHALGVAAPRPAVLPAAAWQALRGMPVAALRALLTRAGLPFVDLPLRLTGASGTSAGHALTVRLVPRRPGDAPAGDHLLAPLLAAGRDEVVVVEARGDRTATCLPDRVLQRLVDAGVEALVADGGLPAGPVPVPTTATPGAPRPWSATHRAAGVNVPVVLQGQLVEPGDLVVADAEGCLAVAAEAQARLEAALLSSSADPRPG